MLKRYKKYKSNKIFYIYIYMYNPKFRQNLIYTTQNDMSFVELIST